MKPTIHIIASCTDRKRFDVPAELRLREIAVASALERAERWWARLLTHNSKAVSALDLYGGDHWSVAKSLPAVARAKGCDARLWVASAGYGLVPAEAELRPYSATFASGHSDSVFPARVAPGSRLDFVRRWWGHLGDKPGPTRAVPRTVTALVKDSPQAYIIVVGSPDYVSAMASDLTSAIKNARRPDRIIIVSRLGEFTSGALVDHLIPSDARLQPGLGGARTSLHVRVVRKILEEMPKLELSARVLRAHYQRVLARSSEVPTFDRMRLSDQQVVNLIQTELRRTPGMSCTRALRALRDRGKACEQSRFRDLFHRTVKTRNAS